jgi:hypothetical protein
MRTFGIVGAPSLRIPHCPRKVKKHQPSELTITQAHYLTLGRTIRKQSAGRKEVGLAHLSGRLLRPTLPTGLIYSWPRASMHFLPEPISPIIQCFTQISEPRACWDCLGARRVIPISPATGSPPRTFSRSRHHSCSIPCRRRCFRGFKVHA